MTDFVRTTSVDLTATTGIIFVSEVTEPSVALVLQQTPEAEGSQSVEGSGFLSLLKKKKHVNPPPPLHNETDENCSWFSFCCGTCTCI